MTKSYFLANQSCFKNFDHIKNRVCQHLDRPNKNNPLSILLVIFFLLWNISIHYSQNTDETRSDKSISPSRFNSLLLQHDLQQRTILELLHHITQFNTTSTHRTSNPCQIISTIRYLPQCELHKYTLTDRQEISYLQMQNRSELGTFFDLATMTLRSVSSYYMIYLLA